MNEQEASKLATDMYDLGAIAALDYADKLAPWWCKPFVKRTTKYVRKVVNNAPKE